MMSNFKGEISDLCFLFSIKKNIADIARINEQIVSKDQNITLIKKTLKP